MTAKKARRIFLESKAENFLEKMQQFAVHQFSAEIMKSHKKFRPLCNGSLLNFLESQKPRKIFLKILLVFQYFKSWDKLQNWGQKIYPLAIRILEVDVLIFKSKTFVKQAAKNCVTFMGYLRAIFIETF